MAEPKKLCIVNADSDLLHVRELAKQFQPSVNRGELQVWYSDQVPLGTSRTDNFRSFLSQADVVLVWISKNLFGGESDFYLLLQQQAELLPKHTRIVPVVAGHVADWEKEDFLKQHKTNQVPPNGKPVPIGNPGLEDAWYAELARDVLAQIGLHQMKTMPRPAFWRKSVFWTWFFIVLSPVLAALALWNDIFPFNRPQEHPLPQPAPLPTAAPTQCEDFPETFDSTQLYLLITRFEDVINKGYDTDCFGKILKHKIDVVKNHESLPIRICYLDSLSPDQSDEAARIRDSLKADFIIWGKLKNTNADCQAGQYCFHYQPSETLIRFVGGAAPENVNYDFFPVPTTNYYEWITSVGDESFEAWIISLYNLKIGKNNPKKFRIAKDWPSSRKAEAYESRGDLFFRFRLYAESVADYDTAIQLQPTFLRYYRRGISLSRMGGREENNKAIEDFTKAAALNPRDPNVYYNRAKSYVAIGHGKKCTDDLNTALSVDPNFIDVYIFLGVNKLHRRDQHQYTHALEYFDTAIRIDPGHRHPNIWNAYGGRGVVKFYLGQPKEALKDLTKAIQMNPKEPSLFCNRASIYDTLGQYHKAMADFDSALRLDSNYVHAWRNRGVIRKNRRHFSEALSDLNKAIALAPDSIEFYEERAYLLTGMEQWSLALPDYNKVISSAPTKQLYYYRGILHNRLGQFNLALVDFEKVLHMDPVYPVNYSRGYTYLCLRKYKDAIADFSFVLRIDPTFYLAYYNRAKAYWYTSHYSAACKDFLRAFRWKVLPGWWLQAALFCLLGVGGVIWKWRRGRKSGEKAKPGKAPKRPRVGKQKKTKLKR